MKQEGHKNRGRIGGGVRQQIVKEVAGAYDQKKQDFYTASSNKCDCYLRHAYLSRINPSHVRR